MQMASCVLLTTQPVESPNQRRPQQAARSCINETVAQGRVSGTLACTSTSHSSSSHASNTLSQELPPSSATVPLGHRGLGARCQSREPAGGNHRDMGICEGRGKPRTGQNACRYHHMGGLNRELNE